MSWPEPGDIAKLKHPFAESTLDWRERNPGVKCDCETCRIVVRAERAEAALRDLFRFSDRPFITVGEADAFEAALAVAQEIIGPCSRCGHAAHSAYCNLGGDPPSYDVCGCADGLPG